MKAIYDQIQWLEIIKEGDQILALLPLPGRPLQVRYF